MMKPLMYEDELIQQLRTCLRNAGEFALGMALITQRGLDLVADDLRDCLERGGLGRILIGIDMPTEPAAIKFLWQLQSGFPSQLKLRVFQSSSRRIFHPKLSLFRSHQGHWSAIVGSANLTNGGLADNYEVSLFVDDHRAARTCLDFFEENFKGGHARKIDAAWLDRYQSNFQLRVKAMKWLEKARNRVRRLRAKRTQSRPVPSQIRGFKFGFTGKIEDWPREKRLYPFVRRRGGEVANKASSLRSADCLVHGQILGGRKSTRKLAAAESHQIPVIPDEEFFEIAEREAKKRSRL
jgi:HKD family nuclease